MKNSILLLGLAFALFSCNSGNKESSTSVANHASKQVNSNSNVDSYKCLEEFKEDYEKLLTKEEMASVHYINFETAKVNLSQGSYGSHEYSWPSDRPDMIQEISGMKMQLPDNNLIGVSNLSFISGTRNLQADKDSFDMGYKQLSEQELEKIEENLSKQSEEVKKTGKDMMKIRNSRSWEYIEDTGNSAWYKWNDKYGGELAVLAGKANFTVKSKINEDPEENKKIAIKLAHLILQKCQ